MSSSARMNAKSGARMRFRFISSLSFALLGVFFDLDQSDTWHLICVMIIVYLVGLFSMMARLFQSGHIYHYAFTMIFGVCALLSFWLLRA